MRQILDLLPKRLRQAGSGTADGVVLRVDDPSAPVPVVSVATVRRGVRSDPSRHRLDSAGTRALGALMADATRGATTLELPPGLLLERDTTLPLATEADLARVLAYEMDRITPFAAEELYWTWRLLRRDRARGQLQVRVSMIPRARIVPLLAALADAGVAPAVIAAPLPDGAPDGVMCRIAVAHGSAATPSQRRAVRGAAAVCAVLAVCVVAAPFGRDIAAIRAADARIAQLRPVVAQVDVLRARIAANAGGADVFAAEQARVGQTLQALAALTDILPDDTYLTALTLRQRVLTFSGQSARAARLIGALADDPGLRNPVFVTPVTRVEGSGRDLFSIRADYGSAEPAR